MAKFRLKIGYEMIQDEDRPGIYVSHFVEKVYTGEFIRNSSSAQSSENLNDGVRLSDSISLVLDPFAIQNFSAIKYAELMGNKWKVESVEVKYPRLILSVGGIWNA